MQKTAYELRISDGSSDVCSSDLRLRLLRNLHGKGEHGSLSRQDFRLAVVARGLIGNQRVLGADTQDRTVRYDAVLALIRRRGCDHNQDRKSTRLNSSH